MTLTADEAQAAVCTGVALGWQVARLAPATSPPNDLKTADAHARQTPQPSASGKPGDVPSTAPKLLRVMQVGVSLAHLSPVFVGTGLDAPDAGVLQPLPTTDAANAATIVAAFDGDTFARLTAADFRVGKAYAIGRRLSQLHDCTAQAADTAGSLDVLRLRVQELRSVLQPHAAKAVVDSIDYWKEWLTNPRTPSSKTAPSDVAPLVNESLPRQVHRWRGMLTGEKDPADLLSSANYLAAGSGIVEGYMHLGREYARRWWPYLLTVTAVVAVIIAAILKWGGGNSGAVAAIITALAGVGVTGRSVSTTLSKAAGEIEGSLREA